MHETFHQYKSELLQFQMAVKAITSNLKIVPLILNDR